eukprot:gene10810-3428_t
MSNILGDIGRATNVMSSSNCGITVTLNKAKDLCFQGGHNSGSLNPYVVFKVGSKFKKESGSVKNTNNPSWKGEIFWIPLKSSSEKLEIEVYSKGGLLMFGASKSLGKAKFDLSVIYKGETKQVELPLQKVPSGSVFISIESINFGKMRVSDFQVDEPVPVEANSVEQEEEEEEEEEKVKKEINKKQQVRNHIEHDQAHGDAMNNNDLPNRKSLDSKGSESKKSTSSKSTDKSIEESYNPDDESIQPRLWKDKESRYKEIDKIGKGGMGTVYSAYDLQTNEQVALKKVSLDDGTSLNQALKEVTPIQGISHTNLVKYKDWFITQDMKKLCLIMDYYKDGDLEHFIEKYRDKNEYIPEDIIKSFMLQLASGLNCLHQKNLVHRDLKPGNIFMENNCLKIGDFGLVKDVSHSIAQTFAGTQKYMGPEYFDDGEGKTFGIEGDMWSLGCVFFELCTLELKNPLYVELFKKQQKGFTRSIEIYVRKNYSQEIVDIILQLLQKKPKDRPNSKILIEMIKGERSAKNTKGIQGPILKNLIKLKNWKGKDIERNWEIKEKEMNSLNKKEIYCYKTKGLNLILKEQIIDLVLVGFKEDFLDNEPDIIIKDYFKFESKNKNGIFKLIVNLLDENEEIVHSFEKNIKQNLNEWEEINHSFKSYGQGIRLVQFIHGSENNLIKIIDSSVILSPQTISNEVINKPMKFKKQIKNWKRIESNIKSNPLKLKSSKLSNTTLISSNNKSMNDIQSLSSYLNIPSERSSFSFLEWNNNFYLFGGCNENRFYFDFYKYDIKNNEWKRLKNEMKLKRSHHSYSIYKDRMLISGGIKLSNYLSDFYEYNFENEKWSKLPNLPEGPLRGHKSLIYQDSLYIFGGSINGLEFSNSLLRFDFLSNKWETIEVLDSSIISGRESCTFVEFKDKFYIFGGLTQNGISNELFTFDLLKKEWNKIEYSGPNLKERCFHSSLILKEKLFIFGGYNSKDGWLNESYEFDFTTNIFSSIENKGTQIPSQRSGHSMILYDDKIWMFGGFSGPNEYFNDLYYCE